MTGDCKCGAAGVELNEGGLCATCAPAPAAEAPAAPAEEAPAAEAPAAPAEEAPAA